MSLKYRIQNAVLRMIMAMIFLLPYKMRVAVAGYFMSKIISPISGYPKRIRDNLALIDLNLSDRDVEQIVNSAPNNAGRTIAELYSATKFIEITQKSNAFGDGLEPLMQALEQKKPVLIVSGHIGNYDAVRGYLAAQGHQVGGLYRPLNNRFMNVHYLNAISQIGQPLFERGRKGLGHLVRHLRAGGPVALLHDQRMKNGELLEFFGRPAMTALSTTELAVKYGALLVPAYGIRQSDGIHFDIHFEAPVPHTESREMMQKLNDSLENQIRQNPGQWLWFHNRWKL